MTRVLVIDDEGSILRTLRINLTARKHDLQIRIANHVTIHRLLMSTPEGWSEVDGALEREFKFGDFVEARFRPTLVTLEPSTRVVNESYLRTHVLSAFGDKPLSAIDYAMCQAWVNELSTRKAPSTVVKAAQIMGKVMKVAVRSHFVPHNPMTDVELPAIKESDDIYLTPAQVKDLADLKAIISSKHGIRRLDLILHNVTSIATQEQHAYRIVESGGKFKAFRR